MNRRAVSAGCAALLWASAASAEPNDVVVLASTAPLGANMDPGLEALLPKLDQLVLEATQDLELTLALGQRRLRQIPSEETLVEQARDGWVVLPMLSREGRALRLRISAVRPGTSVILTRSELCTEQELDVRVAVMMRDLVQSRPAARTPQVEQAAASDMQSEPRSSGRAVLALNAALFGGYVGYSVQAASGSADERLVYPLVALGTGAGIGAAMLVADEWDVTVGGAWFMSAGLWWPTSAGLLLASYHDVAEDDRHVYAVVAGTAGVALAGAAMSVTDVNEGDAALAHT